MAHIKFLAIALFIHYAVGETDCFFPDHQRAENFTTCNAAATHAACCRPEDVCLSNGYCLQQGSDLPNRLIRGACTDYTFSSSACPSKCADSKYHQYRRVDSMMLTLHYSRTRRSSIDLSRSRCQAKWRLLLRTQFQRYFRKLSHPK